MTETIDAQRRRLFGAAAATGLAAQLGLLGSAARAQTVQPHTTFAALKQVKAGVLDVGYAEAGPADGPVVLCLHGWPYDIHTYVDVAPLLAQAGYRVIVPYLRGYGSTRFLSADTPRNGQQGALAADAIALMDALRIERAVIAGCDWGARSACILAALWPERCKALVSVSGYLVANPKTGAQPLPPQAELQWWSQFYLATERGRLGYEKNTHAFARLIWRQASPQWRFDDATFERSARARQPRPCGDRGAQLPLAPRPRAR